MANLTQCDFCKKTQTNSKGFRYLHIKCRKESYKTLSEAKKIDEKYDICEECYQKLIISKVQGVE